jgi:nucleoside-diphosphate-sugar epimerase
MRVFVTGASGFIGSGLVPALESRGHEVRGAGREVRELAAAFRGCDAVVHLANIAHASADPKLIWRVNVDGSSRAAELAAASGVRRFVYLSSVKADNPEQGDHYGRAKLAAEEAVSSVAVRSGLETVILRPPLVYGPRVKANFLALMRAIDRGWPLPFAGIENRRSLLYVGNLCDAIARCLEAEAPDGRTFFVADGAPVSTPQLCRAIGNALGRPARLIAFPPAFLGMIPGMKKIIQSLEVDDSAIRRDLDWRPPYSFEQGLRATADWYRSR